MENEKKDVVPMKIIRTVGTLDEDVKGWPKQLKFISWYEREPKYDIRAWSPSERDKDPGITLTEKELRGLYSLIRDEIFELEN